MLPKIENWILNRNLLLSCFLLFASPLQAQTDLATSNQAVIQLMQNGAAAMHDGKAGDAESYFRQAVANAPDLPDAYLGLGMSELREGKTGEAEQALFRAVEIAPQLAGAHMFLGIAQYQMNKMDAAIASLEQEVNAQPQNVEALTWLGIVELGAGYPDRATGPLDRAAALSPRDPNVLDYRGRAHSLVAEESYRALTALDPDSWRVHRALGEIYSASKQYEEAVVEFRKAIDKQPNSADLYEAIGDEYQHLSRSVDASRAYEMELKLSPHNPIALYNLGKIQVQSGAAERGVALLRQALEANARPAPANYFLALGLAQTGHPEEAATTLEKCLTENPSDYIKRGAYFQLARLYKMMNRKEDAEHAVSELTKLKDAAAKPGHVNDETQ